jgi:RHS repeat-associated protein
MVMAGISSKAAGKLENRYKFNEGTELNTDLGLDWYENTFREYDAQIGRFHQLDPLGEVFENESLYVFAGNNPVLYNDPWGLSKSSKDSTRKASPDPKSIATPKPPPSTAGAMPIPSNPCPCLRPVDPIRPPGRIIPINPTFEPMPLPEIGITGLIFRFFGTLGGVLIPTPSGKGASLPDGFFDPFKGHANRHDNSNPHIVYQFSFTPPSGDKRTPILKYGISDEFRYGLDRPEKQIEGFRMLYGPTVTWMLMTRTNSREQALLIERLFVEQHIKIWREKPRAQIRP